MRRIAFRVVSLLIILAVGLGAVVAWGYAQFVRPGPLTAQKTIFIPRGAGLEEIAALLSEADVVAEPMVFRLGARFLSAEKGLRAGEYAFPAHISAREAVELLQSGKTVVRRVTVVEGLTSAQVAAFVRSVDGLVGEVDAVPDEGSLLPETYHFEFGDTREALLARMTGAMDKAVAELWATRAPDLPIETPEEAVILASVVEKETGLPAERPRVAAVFLNRLRKGMRLQADPTVVYALTQGKGPMDRPLTRADLKTPSPFNTYVSDGLPPTPICNPGRGALEAVLQPVTSDELYFVADGDGGHLFARTLKEHNSNVARWRKIQRERRQQAN